jgi:hypothetical protein
MSAHSTQSNSVPLRSKEAKKPWSQPGPVKEAWKSLPGNRYSAEEIRDLRAQTGFSLPRQPLLSL